MKILWQNGQWIRKIADKQGIDALYARTAGFWPESAKDYDDEYRKAVLSIIYDRLKTLSDLREMTGYFFADPIVDPELIIGNKFLKKFSEEELSELLQISASKLEQTEWNANSLQQALNELLAETNKKPAELFSLIRISLSYAPFSPALHLTMSVLGKNTTIARIRNTVTALENH